MARLAHPVEAALSARPGASRGSPRSCGGPPAARSGPRPGLGARRDSAGCERESRTRPTSRPRCAAPRPARSPCQSVLKLALSSVTSASDMAPFGLVAKTKPLFLSWNGSNSRTTRSSAENRVPPFSPALHQAVALEEAGDDASRARGPGRARRRRAAPRRRARAPRWARWPGAFLGLALPKPARGLGLRPDRLVEQAVALAARSLTAQRAERRSCVPAGGGRRGQERGGGAEARITAGF